MARDNSTSVFNLLSYQVSNSPDGHPSALVFHSDQPCTAYVRFFLDSALAKMYHAGRKAGLGPNIQDEDRIRFYVTSMLLTPSKKSDDASSRPVPLVKQITDRKQYALSDDFSFDNISEFEFHADLNLNPDFTDVSKMLAPTSYFEVRFSFLVPGSIQDFQQRFPSMTTESTRELLITNQTFAQLKLPVHFTAGSGEAGLNG